MEKRPHVKSFTFSSTNYLPIEEINIYALKYNLRIVAISTIAGSTMRQQSIIVAFEPKSNSKEDN